MKIKKLGHCCLVIEENGKRIMTDPGSFSTLQNDERNIDIILYTHEHPDHYHLETLKVVLANNPNVLIVTNTAVGKLLTKAGIPYETLEEKNSKEILGVYFEAHGDKHAFIRKDAPQVQNTGYFIGTELFYPGDALTNPNKPVGILALPVNAPWLKVEEMIDYIDAVKPKAIFPVHDGMLNGFGLNYVKKILTEVLPPMNINFKILEIGKEEEF